MIRAIIVDDEQLALKHLEKQLRNTNMADVVGIYSNSMDVLEDLKEIQFDVAFLDIEMPGLSGLDLAERISDWNKDVCIVFVTAHRDYAVQAFELHSIDYLMKPIMPERLEKTIERIQDQIQRRTPVTSDTLRETSLLKIICFNEFHVYHLNEPVKWKTSKVKELFAYFFTHLRDPIQRDTLIDTLWPDIEYQRAKIQLHTTMSYLRKKLDALGYSNAIAFSNGSYAMDIDQFECDVHQFEAFIEKNPSINDENIETFEIIVEYYSGDYMESTGYEWAGPKAHAVRQKLFYLLQLMVDYYSEKQMGHKKQQYLQLIVSHDPYSEHAIQQLMQFYIDIGKRGEAVQVYNSMKELLDTDLGISPDEATTRLYDSIVK